MLENTQKCNSFCFKWTPLGGYRPVTYILESARSAVQALIDVMLSSNAATYRFRDIRNQTAF